MPAKACGRSAGASRTAACSSGADGFGGGGRWRPSRRSRRLARRSDGRLFDQEAPVAVRRGVWLVIIFIVIAVIVSTAGLIATALLVGRPASVASNSSLVLRVSGDIGELEPGGLFGSFLEPPPTVRSVVESLRKAKVDRRVTSVIVRPGSSGALWGKVQEIRDAIIDFKSSKKPII